MCGAGRGVAGGRGGKDSSPIPNPRKPYVISACSNLLGSGTVLSPSLGSQHLIFPCPQSCPHQAGSICARIGLPLDWTLVATWESERRPAEGAARAKALRSSRLPCV